METGPREGKEILAFLLRKAFPSKELRRATYEKRGEGGILRENGSGRRELALKEERTKRMWGQEKGAKLKGKRGRGGG